MKYTVLENAAVEASTGLHEIDAEIDQIETRKLSLRAKRESLETVGRQLCTVLSAISDGKTDNGGNDAGALTDAPAAEPAATVDAQPEVDSAPILQPEVAAAPISQPEADSAPLLQENASTFSLVGEPADAPAEEQPALEEALEAQPEAQEAQEAQPDAHEQEEWENCTPVGATSGTQEAKAPTFKELLSQSKPYSLRNDGWPACKPVAQRALRDLL
jgi:hypothetical protein